MLYNLENALASVEVDSQGAELSGFTLVSTGRQYIWAAEPEVWARHAPILFPIVGKLKMNEYRYKDKTYYLPQHGFARDMAFTLRAQSENSLEFELKESEATLKVFPFQFVLRVKYVLVGTCLNISYTVLNPSETEPLYFSIGAHPGFNTQANPDESKPNYYLEFSEPETLYRVPLEAGLLLEPETEPFIENATRIPLTDSLFARDALVFENHKSGAMALKCEQSTYSVQIGIKAPYLGIWAKDGAPFVCIEPWEGIADSKQASGQFADKKGIKFLAPGGSFAFDFHIAIS
jgi:galactose mutarotase-like enzyme